MQKVKILGVGIDNLSLQEVLENVKHFLNSKNQHFIVTPNPEFLVAADQDEEFKKILNYADISVTDGAGIFYAAKFFYGERLQRVTGVDLMWNICDISQGQDWPIFLLGGQQGVAKTAKKVLEKAFPEINIVGAQSGGEIKDVKSDYAQLIADINVAKPAILFVAFGQGKQEKWIFNHLDRMPSVKLAMGVGGSFDYISGRIKRAPEFLRRIGLEWLYRLIKEPSRYKRIFNAIIVFPVLVIKNKISKNV